MTKKREEVSEFDASVLATLPKEPLAWSVPEIAEDVIGKTDSPSLGHVRAALRRHKSLLYVEFVNTRPYGHKDTYGIRADRWRDVQAALTGKDGLA